MLRMWWCWRLPSVSLSWSQCVSGTCSDSGKCHNSSKMSRGIPCAKNIIDEWVSVSLMQDYSRKSLDIWRLSRGFPCVKNITWFNSLRPSDAYMHQLTNKHWSRQWPGAWPVPRDCLNQCWNIVNWTLRNNRNSYVFIQENALENGVWKMAAILSEPQCVKFHNHWFSHSDKPVPDHQSTFVFYMPDGCAQNIGNISPGNDLSPDGTKPLPPVLTHDPLDKMAAILQTIFSDAFWWMKNFVFWLNFHWSLFLRVQLTITQDWFR